MSSAASRHTPSWAGCRAYEACSIAYTIAAASGGRHAQLVHGGEDHRGACRSLECIVTVVGGWASGSRCPAFLGEPVPMVALQEDDDPPIPDDPTGPQELAQPHAESVATPDASGDTTPHPLRSPQPTAAEIASCFTHGDFDSALPCCPSCAQPTAAEIAGRLK